MTVTTPWPYFILSACMISVAGVLARILRLNAGKLNIPLESLRGLLATSVLFHHAMVNYFYFQTGKWLMPPSRFYVFLGSAPVTLFFFLSGFLFWSKCIAHNGIGGYGTFLVARARRLVPAYYASVGIMLLIVFLNTHFKLAVPLKTFGGELARLLMFLPTPSVNGFQQAFYINAGVVWTLMCEIVFYLLLPLLFWLFKGYRVFIYIALASCIPWVLARHGVVFTVNPPPTTKVGPLIILVLDLFFGLGFGLGMVVAFLNTRCPQHWRQVLRQRRWTPIPLFFLAAPVLLKVDLYTPTEFFLLIVVFVFVVAGNDFLGLLSSPAVFLLGTVSYSFYITHGIVLFALSHLLNRWIQIRTLSPLQYWSLIGVVGVITVCFATLLYWTVERRFMKPSSALSRTFTAEQQEAGALVSR
jgi:peptidoglycan/LPS O-acetylase OafA/YrhL